MNVRSRDWCFTINNYTDVDYDKCKEISVISQYIVMGKEVASTGTNHIQGYVYFKDAKSFAKLQKLMPKGTHIEKAKGTPHQASDYCKKDGDYQEYGELPQISGKRNDLDIVRDIVKDGGTMREVVEVARSYQSVKMAEQLFKYKEKPRNWKPVVYWFYGATGAGKTKMAVELLGEDFYTAMSVGKWWEGYDAHENVLIDDMRKDFMKFHELLRLLDRYAMRIETKGGSRQFLAKKIIITSCYHPKDLFDTREDIMQLLRRIDDIKEFI